MFEHESPNFTPRENPFAGIPLRFDPENVHELSGLPNRTALDEALADAVHVMPGNFGMVAMDLDGLKAINDDEGGHAEGDRYIYFAAGALRDSIRHTDLAVVVHISGDEFAVLFPGVDEQEELDGIITRVQTVLEDLGVPVSMGGKIHTPGETAEQLKEAADKLLEQNKLQRKYEGHTPEQRAVVREIAALAIEADINLRDVPGVLKAIHHYEDGVTLTVDK